MLLGQSGHFFEVEIIAKGPEESLRGELILPGVLDSDTNVVVLVEARYLSPEMKFIAFDFGA